MSDANEHRSERRALVGFGLALVALALAFNERTVARFLTSDGALGGNSLWVVRGLEAMLLVLGGAMIALRARLAGPVARVQPFADGRITTRGVLLAAIALRVVVFLTLNPENGDPHKVYLRFLLEHGRLPWSDEILLGFQAPLYYLLAAPLAATGSLKVTQVLSLVLAIVNLVLIHRLVTRTRLLRTSSGRCHAMMLAGFLPQFVLFSSFVSNDALAYPLGTLIVLRTLVYLEAPTRRNVLWIAVAQGLGLLTKGTLLAFLPTVGLIVLVVELRKREPMARRVAALALFGATTVALGGYKFVQNTVRFGHPVPTNEDLEYPYIDDQEGPDSLVDVNVLRLVRAPIYEPGKAVSVPLLFYGTFWGSYIYESTYTATRSHPWLHVQRGMHLVGIVPSLLLLLGLVVHVARTRALLRPLTSPVGDENERQLRTVLGELLVLLGLAAAVTLVMRWGLLHDAWSFYQSRLFFVAFAPLAVIYAWGHELVAERSVAARWFAGAAAIAAYALFGVYFAVEIGHALVA